MTKASNIDGSDSSSAVATNRISMKQSNTFPFRLHEMLDTVAQEGSESIVSWCPGNNATAFKVHKPQEFVKTIMPRFFQQTKYKSFQRQCNLWGFERLLHGPEKGGYEHPEGFFVRGNPSLVNKMIRRKIKRRSSLETETSVTQEYGTKSVAVMASMTTDTISTTSQRRPSIVSLSSHQSGSSGTLFLTGQLSFPTQGHCTEADRAPGTATSFVPDTPMVSSYYGSSVESSPHDAPEGLYLPPPQPAIQEQEDNTADSSAAGDTLFFEGLSAFFEDDEGEVHSIVPHQTAPCVPLLAYGTEQQQAGAMALFAEESQRLQPKRRLSMELFVASRQQNSKEVILDLLSDADTLQKSLEMELMCSVAPAV